MRRTIWRRMGAVVLALALVLGAVPSALAADEALTRGEALETLLAAAEGYREDLDASTVLLGDEGGPRESDALTRVEALLMLNRMSALMCCYADCCH